MTKHFRSIGANIRINAINKSKMEKKQNSVEWAIQQISKVALDCRNGLSDKAFHVRKEEILEQAKAMHKEEIEEAYMVGNHSKMRGGRAILEVTEKYYNETFGGQDNE
jgi:hypothetical protein